MYFKPILRQLWLTRNNWTYITYITRLLRLYRTKVLFSTEDWMSPPWAIYTKPDTRTMALSRLWTQSPTCIIWVPWGYWCRYDIATIPLARNQHFTQCHETGLYFILFFIFCLLLSFLHLLPFSFSLPHRVACRRTHVSKRIYIFLCNKGPPSLSLSFYVHLHQTLHCISSIADCLDKWGSPMTTCYRSAVSMCLKKWENKFAHCYNAFLKKIFSVLLRGLSVHFWHFV